MASFLLFIYHGFDLSDRSGISKARPRNICSPGGFDCLFEYRLTSSFFYWTKLICKGNTGKNASHHSQPFMQERPIELNMNLMIPFQAPPVNVFVAFVVCNCYCKCCIIILRLILVS